MLILDCFRYEKRLYWWLKGEDASTTLCREYHSLPTWCPRQMLMAFSLKISSHLTSEMYWCSTCNRLISFDAPSRLILWPNVALQETALCKCSCTFFFKCSEWLLSLFCAGVALAIGCLNDIMACAGVTLAMGCHNDIMAYTGVAIGCSVSMT